MPVSVGAAYVDVRPDLSNFSRELKGRVESDMGPAGTQAGKKFGSSFSASIKGAMAGFGAAFAAVKIGDFIGDAIGGARDLEESVNKSNVVFGESAGIISAWADDAASSIGLSKQAAYDAVGTFGNMFGQMGVGSEQAASLSMGIVNLASDFASFHNADISDVIAAQSAAFRGEYDSVQRFLPLLTAATVEQRALKMTGKATTKELTAQDKALAVNIMMYEGAGDAQGDFERTSDSLANQQRTLSAEWANAKTELGEGLLPMMTNVAKFANDELVPAFKTLFTTGGEATGWAAGIKDVFGDLMGWWATATAKIVRLLATGIEAIPGGWGEDVADQLRTGADELDAMAPELHKSQTEIKGLAVGDDELTKATKGVAAATGTFTKSLTDSNKAVRDAAAGERDLRDAKKDLAALIAEGAVNDKDVTEARKSLAEATRSAASADRDLADAQEEYDKAKAAADILGTDTALEAAEDAADGLADATDSSASAHERAAEAAAELKKAQAGDPEFQDKLADARDRVADAEDKVATAEQKVIDMAGGVVTATNNKTEAQRLLNVQLGDTKTKLTDINALPGGLLQQGMPGPLAEGILGAPPPFPMVSASTAMPSNLIGIPNVQMGQPSPQPTTINNIEVKVTEPQRDPGLIGKAIAWAL